MSSFQLIAKATLNGFIDVFKYKSEATGLTVVLADIEGPVVNGRFVLATEAHDDDGLPHTLEHLIFLGSEKYPYKGVLDLLANRCLASGTNAWTDTDHTCYTMTTAGSDGFLKLMPIYLDHILYPTLTDSGFVTEVHHISGEGEDGGVVYCEMQGRENTRESKANLQLIRAAYPDSGYSSETGGTMKCLRTSTNNEKVRAYHAQFYRPENLTIIVTGKVKSEDVFEALKPIEEKIIAKGKGGPFTRPWQTPVAPIAKSQDIKILHPSDEEDCGLVYVGYRGPNSATDYLSLTGCNLLLRYFTDTAVSPLQREFVEIDDPYASKVSHSVIENLESLLYFIFENVPMPKIDLIYSKLQDILGKFIKGEEHIDMKRMRSVIEREILESLSNLEGSPHDTAAYLIIGDVIYGQHEKDFEQRLNIKKQLEHFLEVDEKDWLDLLKKFIIDGNFICVRAYPSIEEQARMSKEELDRIEKQRTGLGPEGLKRKAEEVKKAMEQNELEPPETMLTEVPVPSVEGINFHYLKVYKPNEANLEDNFKSVINFQDFPIYAEIYDIHTNFVYMTLTMNTEGIEERLRPYLLLFLELILESPVQRGDVLIPYEEVVAALERDTISSEAKLGLESSPFCCGPFSNTALMILQVHPSKYEVGVNWMKELLQFTEFLPERIKVCSSKMFNAVCQTKRKGNSVVRDLLKAMYYEKNSNVQVSSMIRQQKFLGSLIEGLDDPEKAKMYIADLNSIRSFLTQNRALAIHIAANLNNLQAEGKSLSKPWRNFINDKQNPQQLSLKFVPDWKILKPHGLDPHFQGTVVGLGSVESAFLFHSAPSINNFMDPDLPVLMLYLQYLTQLEGPLWRQIRGQGFAYGYNIVPRPHEGLLCLTFYRANNIVAAFKETKVIIEKQLSETVWDPNLLESARSSLIFEIIERERSVGNLVFQSLLASFKQIPADYNKMLVKRVNAVTEDDLNGIGSKYISSLFSSVAKTAIVCHPDKVSEIVTAFECMDRKLTGVLGLDESILAK